MRVGATDVRVDDPHRSKGGNPDLIFNWGGLTWAIACKALHSRVPETIFDRMRDGIAQIEASRAERGIVLLNAKNVIAHGRYMRRANSDEGARPGEPLYHSLQRSEPQRLLRTEVDTLLAGVRDAIDPREMLDAFLGMKTIPAWVMWAHTTSVVDFDGRPMLTSAPRTALSVCDRRTWNFY
jgi:hypothetical protein